MSIDRLQRIADRATREDGEWLMSCVRISLNRDIALEQVLALRGPQTIRQRDCLLRMAADLLDADRNLGPWKRAGKLENAINYYQSVVLSKLKKDPEYCLSDLNNLIHRAFALKCRMVKTQRRLFDVLTDNLPP